MGVFLKLLSLCALVVSARADQSQSVDSEGYYFNQFSVCEDSVIVVQELSILCDSPGTYYYGSNKYRNSATCQSGDKAKVSLVFQVTEDLDGYTPYITMSVSGYGTIQATELYEDETLCDINQLYASTSNTQCPWSGWYKIQRTFTIGEQYDGYEYGYVPKVSVGFMSNKNKGVYDLGGANTDMCAGDTFINWTKGVRKSAANTIRTFFATFGILLGAVLAVFFAGWLIMRQSRNQPKEVILEDPLDDQERHKVALVGSSRNNLVDL